MHNYIHFYSDRYPGEIPKCYNSILTLIWTLWFSIFVAWLPGNLSSRGRRRTTLADAAPKFMRTNPLAQLCRRRQGLRFFRFFCTMWHFSLLHCSGWYQSVNSTSRGSCSQMKPAPVHTQTWNGWDKTSLHWKTIQWNTKQHLVARSLDSFHYEK